jgi:hypothetical protein
MHVTTIFYFLFFLYTNTKMSHHSGTTTCRKANMWYTSHNMYLIFRVNIYAAEHIQHNLDSRKHIYKHIC